MKRFVTYLYEYKDGQKIKNTGHLRVDIRDQIITMQVSIKQFELTNETGTFYIIVKEEKLEAIPLEAISMCNGQYNGRISCALQNVIGVGIRFQNEGYIASSWREEEEEHIARGEIFNSTCEGEEELPFKTDILVEDSKEEMYFEVEEQMMAAAMVEEPPMEREELELLYQKINLNEIHSLPSKHWHFSNNSFLIHGFWNYGYLVLKKNLEEDQKRVSLGVPGIFEQPEMVMATCFGFSEFEALPPQMVEMEIGGEYRISREEKNQEPKVGTFGCWFVNL